MRQVGRAAKTRRTPTPPTGVRLAKRFGVAPGWCTLPEKAWVLNGEARTTGGGGDDSYPL